MIQSPKQGVFSQSMSIPFWKLNKKQVGFLNGVKQKTTNDDIYTWIQPTRRDQIRLWKYYEKPRFTFFGKIDANVTNLTQTSFVFDSRELFYMMTSDQQDIKNVPFVNDEAVQVDWVNHDEYIEPSAQTNVVIATYTTAIARMKLYSYLQQLSERTLYCDTDSVVFTSSPGQWQPRLGDYLADLADETLDNNIISFVTGEPHNSLHTLCWSLT